MSLENLIYGFDKNNNFTYPSSEPGLRVSYFLVQSKEFPECISISKHTSGNDGIYNIDEIDGLPMCEFILKYNIIERVPLSKIKKR